jgi:hypothetical protein
LFQNKKGICFSYSNYSLLKVILLKIIFLNPAIYFPKASSGTYTISCIFFFLKSGEKPTMHGIASILILTPRFISYFAKVLKSQISRISFKFSHSHGM